MGGRVTRMESKRFVRILFIMKHEGVYLEDACVDGWLILKYNMKFYSGLNWLEIVASFELM
jgi:hypothetical protein